MNETDFWILSYLIAQGRGEHPAAASNIANKGVKELKKHEAKVAKEKREGQQ